MQRKKSAKYVRQTGVIVTQAVLRDRGAQETQKTLLTVYGANEQLILFLWSNEVFYQNNKTGCQFVNDAKKRPDLFPFVF